MYEMRQTDSACQLFIFLTVFKHILCVRVYWAITGEFPRLHRPWWMVPVFVCVSTCTCIFIFLINAKYHPPPPKQIADPVYHHTTSNEHTHTQYRHSFHSLLLHLLNVHSTVMPWIISDQEHQHPFSDSLPPTSGNLLSLQTRDHD